MPLFNVAVTLNTTMVVFAEDADDAYQVALDNADSAFSDVRQTPLIHVTGEVSEMSSLRDGWDGECLPYGGDGQSRISKILQVD